MKWENIKCKARPASVIAQPVARSKTTTSSSYEALNPWNDDYYSDTRPLLLGSGRDDPDDWSESYNYGPHGNVYGGYRIDRGDVVVEEVESFEPTSEELGDLPFGIALSLYSDGEWSTYCRRPWVIIRELEGTSDDDPSAEYSIDSYDTKEEVVWDLALTEPVAREQGWLLRGVFHNQRECDVTLDPKIDPLYSGEFFDVRIRE
jgi:hypothetical protein